MINYIIFALLLTLCVEGIIYAAFSLLDFKTYFATFIANIVLNLTMNLILSSITIKSIYISILVLFEVSTFATEGFIFFLCTKKPIWYCLLAAFAANLTSLAIGDKCNHYLKINETGTFLISSGIFITIIILNIVLVILYRFVPRLFGKKDDRDDNQTSDESHKE